MVDWQMGMAESRAGFGELMDDGLGRMMEEGRAIISSGEELESNDRRSSTEAAGGN